MIEPTSKATPRVKNTHPTTVFNWLAKKPIIPLPSAQQIIWNAFFRASFLQILIYRTDYTIKQKRIKEFICNFIQHLSYVFCRSEGPIAFFVLLCYTIYIKGFCIKKRQKSQKTVKMQNTQKPLWFKGFPASFWFGKNGDALRIATDRLDSKNFYACNPEFDKGCEC